jgi:hypothetical protein
MRLELASHVSCIEARHLGSIVLKKAFVELGLRR